MIRLSILNDITVVTHPRSGALARTAVTAPAVTNLKQTYGAYNTHERGHAAVLRVVTTLEGCISNPVADSWQFVRHSFGAKRIACRVAPTERYIRSIQIKFPAARPRRILGTILRARARPHLPSPSPCLLPAIQSQTRAAAFIIFLREWCARGFAARINK